jgi:formimidoylglutamate deiminase
LIVLEADLTWTGERFQPGVRVEVAPSGRIASVRTSGSATHRLKGRALLPGFVNAHSHAFQRGLRGLGERFPSGTGSFWTWREAMYALVGRLGPTEIRSLTRRAFAEMIGAGITTVGEFHYMHHPAGAFDWALDEGILEAARDVGIRLVLLEVFYRTGGIGKPLTGAQVRFDSRSVQEYWRQVDALERRLDRSCQSLGVAPHSIRAASLEELVSVHAEARARGLVVHMHVDETVQEGADCRAAYGHSPLQVLMDRLDLDAGFTAVHGTHCSPAELDAFFRRGANLCLCPLTEANLGDGIPQLRGSREPPLLALGTDSNARISPLEEMRWAEYGQRLAGEQRGSLLDGSGDVARTLLRAATSGGARSLRVEAGAIESGRWADLVEVDLSSTDLEGWTTDTLLESFVFGAGERSIANTWVGGRPRRVQDGALR